jgi:hypothetical protein
LKKNGKYPMRGSWRESIRNLEKSISE